MEVYEKQLKVWALKKNIRPVLLDTLAAMYVTCNMFWCIVLISACPIMISAFKKSTVLKEESLRLQKKSLISRKG